LINIQDLENIINTNSLNKRKININNILKIQQNGLNLSDEILLRFRKIKVARNISAAYLIWQNPLMVAASSTFINNMMGHCGFINVYSDKIRYPQTTLDELAERKPEVIILSTEPFPFTENHVSKLQVKFPESKVVLADGTMFSWYGSRMLDAPEYFSNFNRKLN
jgi:ABC-type Fe3+-hydroxamate transport system substrate-binding protein